MGGSAGKDARGAYVAFRIEDQLYGIDVMKVYEISAMTDLRPVPGAPVYVRGVMNLRGTCVPVIDFRLKSQPHAGRGTEGSVILIVDVKGKPVGMAADSVIDVVTIEPDDADLNCNGEDSCFQERIYRALSSDRETEFILIGENDLLM